MHIYLTFMNKWEHRNLESIGIVEAQGIVNMYSDAWYWYTMHDWAR